MTAALVFFIDQPTRQEADIVSVSNGQNDRGNQAVVQMRLTGEGEGRACIILKATFGRHSLDTVSDRSGAQVQHLF